MTALSASVALLITGCPGKAPWAPSLTPAFGARVSEGKLQIWTGSHCSGVTRLGLSFKPSNAELILTASSRTGVDVDRFALDGPYPAGLTVSQPLPPGFDWRTQQSMHLSPDGGSSAWGTTAEIAEIVTKSPEHSDDTFWFQDVGWLNPGEVSAQNGKTFLATCTPDPAKKRH